MHFAKRPLVLLTTFLSVLVVIAGQVVFAGVPEVHADETGVTASAATNATEMLIFEVNRNVTKKDRGFPKDDPPKASANGNWYNPVNFAEGTLHFRVQVRNQPQPQNMRIQWCVWQDRFYLENCGSQARVRGESGTVVTWSQGVQDMWKLGGRNIDWRRPRQRYGLAIKNSQGKPVSDFKNWNWHGEDPDKWYPLNVRVSVVVVAKGATFSGWQNYGGGGGGGNPPTPTPTTTPTPGPGPQPTVTPTPTPPPTGECDVPNNLVQNGSLENNLRSWRFHSKRIGSQSTTNAAYECDKAAQLAINQSSNNIQFYQTRVSLKANTRYRLSFAAYSSGGQDMGVYLQKHGSPYTNYGLKAHQVNLRQGWEVYTIDFTTNGFSGTTNDGRLRFWMAPFAQSGDNYWIDAVRLVELNAATAASEPEGNASVVTTDDAGLLVGLTEAEFDSNLVDMADVGNVIELENQLYLPFVAK